MKRLISRATMMLLTMLLTMTAQTAWADDPAWLKTGDNWDATTKTLTVNSNPEDNAYQNNSEIENVIISNDVTTINYQAFNGCTALASLTLGSSVESIGDYAFYGCSSLTALTIPASVKTIGYAAFADCSLTTLTIPATVETVGQNAFNCSTLTTATVPNISGISSDVFSGCTNLTTLTINGTGTISDANPAKGSLSGCLTTLTIGNDITGIGVEAFKEMSELTTLTLGNDVTSIGKNAFDGCSKLTSLTIPDKVTSINYQAFNGCTALASLTLGSSVESIGDYAFYGCSSLTALTIPASVKTIGYAAFADCSLTTLTIPATVETVKSGAFSCSTLTSATVPNNSGISSDVFSGCAKLTTLTINGTGTISKTNPAKGSLSSCLTTLTIGNDITGIGDEAFKEMSELTTLTLGNDVTSIGENAFNGCSKLASLTIPNNVTSINCQAFNGCTALASLTLGSSVESIGDYAFYGCSSLTALTIPASVKTIGYAAFGDCSLTTLTIPATVEKVWSGAFSCSTLTSATVPNISGIASDVFSGCTDLTTLTINGTGTISATNPAKGSLSGCLTTLTIGNGITCIGDEAFKGMSELTTLTLGNDVTSIGENAFNGCSKLASLTIPNNVTSINYQAFDGCTALASLTLGSSVESIGDYAFYGCSSLTALTIPASVKTIGYAAFGDCSLTTLEIPATVETVGQNAFNCSTLTTATVPNISGISKLVFNGCTKLTTLTINGTGTISATNPAKGSLSGCLTTLTIGDDITGIGDNAFEEMSELTTLTIGNGVTSIGENAFNGCSKLASIAIPASVTSIGDNAFGNCSGLETITVAEENPKYDSRNGCNAIIETTDDILVAGCKNTVIPGNIKSIGDYAFHDCDELTTITIPASVTNIGQFAFQYCENLAVVNVLRTASVPTIEYYTFAGNKDGRKIYVCGGSVDAYKAADKWKDYYVSAIESLPTLTLAEGITTTGDNVATQGGITYGAIGSTITLAHSDKAGYQFGGYSMNGTAIEGNTFTMTTGNVSVTATWTPIEYTITYDLAADDAVNGYGNPTKYTIESNDIYLSQPTRDGYAFTGWTGTGLNDAELYVVIEQGSTGDRTYTATWLKTKDFSQCTATVPNQLYNYGYYIGYNFEGEDHGGIKVYDPEGNLLTYGTDYFYKGTESLDTDKYNDDYCTHVGERCRVTLEGCNAWVGTITVDFVILPLSGSGTWGDLSWSVANGTLSITGSGAMNAATGYDGYPWYALHSVITAITIDEGVTSVADYAFGGNQNAIVYGNATTVSLPSTLTSIGNHAFAYCTALSFDIDDILANTNVTLANIGNEAFNQVGSITGTLNNAGDNTAMLDLMAAAAKANVKLSGRTLVKDGDWNTLCLPFSLDADEIAASPLAGATIMKLDVTGYYNAAGHRYPYDDASFTNTGFDAATGTLTLYFQQVTAIEDGTPYLIKWATGDPITDLTFNDVMMTNTPKASVSEDRKVSFQGTFSTTALPVDDKSNLFLGAANTLYYPNGSNANPADGNYYVNAFRGYFHVDLAGGAQTVRAFRLNFGDEQSGDATSINEELRMKNEEFLETFGTSDQGRAAAAAEWYTLDGRRLDGVPTAKGVYIHRGNKVVIK